MYDFIGESATVIRTPLDILLLQIGKLSTRGITGQQRVELLYYTMMELAGLDQTQGFDAVILSRPDGQHLLLSTQVDTYKINEAADLFNMKVGKPFAARPALRNPLPTDPDVTPLVLSINLGELCKKTEIGIKLTADALLTQPLEMALQDLFIHHPNDMENLQKRSGTRRYSTAEQTALWQQISRRFVAPSAEVLITKPPMQLTQKFISNASIQFNEALKAELDAYNDDLTKALHRMHFRSDIEKYNPNFTLLSGDTQAIEAEIRAAGALTQDTERAAGDPGVLPQVAHHMDRVKDETLRIPRILPYVGLVQISRLVEAQNNGNDELGTISLFGSRVFDSIKNYINALQLRNPDDIARADEEFDKTFNDHARHVPVTQAERIRFEPINNLITQLREDACRIDRSTPLSNMQHGAGMQA